MSQSKREQVVSHLRYIRQELREMHQGVLDDGLRTKDILTKGMKEVSTTEMGDAIISKLK